ncbi:MAG TPA: MFS transporter [Candidatus Eremiobacteraceae bacterium]|jgi:MFS family permease
MKPPENVATRGPNPAALSFYWFAIEAHWAAMLGAAVIGQIARFSDPSFVGRASSILLGTGALFAIASQFVAGRASDRARRRLPFIIAGTLCDVAALFAFAFAPSFIAVIVAFVAVQISLNAANGPYQALLPDLVEPAKQGRASAVMGLFRLSGNAAGLLLARVLVRQPGPGVSTADFEHGLLMLAVAMSVLLLAGLLTTVLFVREQPASASAAPRAVESLFRLWPYRSSFIALIVSRSLISLGLYSILPFFAFFLKNALHVATYLHTSLDLLLTMTLCSLIGTLPAGILSDRVSKKALMYGAIAGLSIGALGLAFAPGLPVVIAVAIPLGIGWGAYYSVDWALACNLLPNDRAGGLMAIWNIGSAGPQVLAPLIGGLFVDHLGAGTGGLGLAYRAVFALVAVYLVLGAGALAFVREPLRDATEGMARSPR